ncbi:MAG: 2-succinyl-5-enolpyruvyl-6-hydroxy-3-cyclohexene-1-carboxylic-acid synthase [Actinomycetota bacterium]
MTSHDVNASFAMTVVDEWARLGVTDAVISPGSRSAPLALALARDPRIAVSVVVDERSAAFCALGIGLATGTPAILVCTSGTAAANFHPAVIEAQHARVPMLVLTADRPPELRAIGAGQTIDQAKLYGDAVRWFHDPGPPRDAPDARAQWRTFACRAAAEAVGPPAGPVHCNLPLREPLVAIGVPPDTSGRPNGQPWVTNTRAPRVVDDATINRLARLVREHPDGLLVAGWGARVSAETTQRFAAAAGWPILADPISNVRTGPLAISTYDALLRTPEFAHNHRPSLVVRVGAPLTSKVATTWLDGSIPHVLIDPDDSWLDPGRVARERIAADAEPLLSKLARALTAPRRSPWLQSWIAAEREGRVALDAALDELDEPIEGLVARDLAAVLPDGANLVVASSLPVRALEWCMAPREGVRVFANRGVNGIDGFVSTALGIATASAAPTAALVGDLCFLHDTSGLLGARDAAPVTFVIIDNDGGGIFSYLPQSQLPADEFETLFGTPHGLDLVAVARAYGVPAERAEDLGALKDALAAGGTRALVIPVDRTISFERHRAAWQAVAAAIR